tara:strand:- start:405 stop:974 length:570 start_codon:yes stop_codon:yes gene_type:complete
MAGRVKTYRFKLGREIQSLVAEFAGRHAALPREAYKLAWNEWLKEHAVALREETNRLHHLGFRGDVEEKLFKSGRYYFRRHKPAQKKGAGEEGSARPRRHIPTTKDLRDTMDVHIRESYTDPGFRPATGYAAFCMAQKALLAEEALELSSTYGLSQSATAEKLKRTYKNRYFLLRPKLAAEGDAERSTA